MAQKPEGETQKKLPNFKRSGSFFNGGDRIRTCDLEVMSLASYQLLYPASYESFLNDFFSIAQIFIFARGCRPFFLIF